MTSPRRRDAPPAAARRRAAAGFTLLELVAVIGIIAVMSLVVVGGFNGIIRALSADTGTAALVRALNLARQQACVDGETVYVWITGMDSFSIVRRAGTIAERTNDAQDFVWAGGSLHDPSDGRAVWVFDSYADLSNAGIDFSFDETYDEDAVRAVFDQYTGMLAFDMDSGTMANVIVPPTYNKEADAWVFGVDKSAAGTDGFKAGHDYGWLVIPEQFLPKGYVFADSFDSSGAWKKDYDKKVCFDPTGVPDGEITFPVLETATGKTGYVKVTGKGKITRSDKFQ
jgi:prepilin-type N-terminal cleavage/methylation domain-containing protein